MSKFIRAADDEVFKGIFAVVFQLNFGRILSRMIKIALRTRAFFFLFVGIFRNGTNSRLKVEVFGREDPYLHIEVKHFLKNSGYLVAVACIEQVNKSIARGCYDSHLGIEMDKLQLIEPQIHY